MLTIIAFIITIGIIVTIHEYGHFQVARWCGVKVLRFSIGFGKPLWRKTVGKDQTEFVLAAIPLGGYVKMLDENELSAQKEIDANNGKGAERIQNVYSEAELQRAFNRQSVYKRIAIVLAGPMANMLLAILIYWVLLMQGVVGMLPMIGQVNDGSLAANATFAKGEVIKSIDGKPIETWSEARWALLEATIENKQVIVKTINDHNEQHLHRLDLASISKNTEVDVLDKIGIEMFAPDFPAILGQILPDGAALQAGLKENDKVLSIDQNEISNWRDVVDIVQASADKSLLFEVSRQAEILNITVTPQAETKANKIVGKIGVAVKLDQAKIDALLIEQHYSMTDSLGMAINKTWKTSVFSLKMLWYMVTGQTSWKAISGPVTIASYAGRSADLGLKAFFGFLALISISVGVLNLLPIPVLDGGHLMYYVAELIKGTPVSEQAMQLGQKVGLGLLTLLMTVAIFNDVNRIILG